MGMRYNQQLREKPVGLRISGCAERCCAVHGADWQTFVVCVHAAVIRIPPPSRPQPL